MTIDVEQQDRRRRSPTAMPITSLKPRMKLAPSSTSMNIVMHHALPGRSTKRRAKPDACSSQIGLCSKCSAASAAESVLVITKSVAAKPEQREHDDLAGPAAHQPLEHLDRALPVGRHARDVRIDGQRAEQRDQHQHDGRHRREHAGRFEGDRRLIAERAEIVDARQTHDPEPEALVMVAVTVFIRMRLNDVYGLRRGSAHVVGRSRSFGPSDPRSQNKLRSGKVIW